MASFSAPTPYKLTFPNSHKFLNVKRPFYPQPSPLFPDSPTLCRCSSSDNNSNNRRWDLAIQDALKNAVKRFDSYMKDIEEKKKKEEGQRNDGVLKHEKGEEEWDWDRWKRHFEEVDEEERLVSILKSQLGKTVYKEEYEDAARLKVAIAAAAINDTVGRVISNLNRAVVEERYEDAALLRDRAGAGLVGWWAGISEDKKDPYGLIIRVTAEHGKYVARSYSPRQLATAALGVPIFEIFITENKNGVLSGGSAGNSIKKAVFEKDFPSLGSEERQGVPDVGRVSSPGLTSACQSLPVGSSTLIGGEGWTSALAEVPPIIGSSGSGSFSAQTGSTTTLSGSPSVTAGLNMAEALAQTPSRARTVPQVSVKTQRLDELTIRKSKQLIPVTPSMPKGSVLNFSDKSKPKTAARISEMNIAVKNGQQQPSSLHHANQSLYGGNAKSDVPKTSHGKLLVLKPAWENGVPHSAKDGASLTNNANSRPANNQLAVIPPVASAASRSPNNPKLSPAEHKAIGLNLISGFTVERKPSFSQTQSRNDFFNLLKKKNSMNSSVLPADSGSDMSSPTVEKPGEVTKEVISTPVSPHSIENGVEVTTNGDSHEQVQRFSDMGEKTMSRYAAVDPDEEAAFLRSLGWEENSGEDEGLTEEEIKAFYQEFEKRGMQLKLPQYRATGASSELSSSNSGSEA